MHSLQAIPGTVNSCWLLLGSWEFSGPCCPLTSTACPSSRSKPTTQMQCSQAEKRSHGSRAACSDLSSLPGPGGRVISSAGEMLTASWSSRSSGSSTGSPISSEPCSAMATARYRHADARGDADDPSSVFAGVFSQCPLEKSTTTSKKSSWASS